MQPVLVREALDRRLAWTMAAAVALVALAASAIGIRNGFVYDDNFVIVHNTAIDALPRWWKIFTWPYWPPVMGGDGYRPLTILSFAIEWAIADGSPVPFHAANILGYALVSVAVFRLALLLLPPAYAALAALLFAAHPVHVEAVANVVGQSEVTAGLVAVITAILYIRWRRADRLTWPRMVALGVLYLVGCLFKEHAIMIPALLLAAETFVVESPGPRGSTRRRLWSQRVFWMGLAATGVIYIGIRSAVLPTVKGFALYVPFQMLDVGPGERVLTMIGMVPHWVRLFLWPAHLRSEYGPPEFPIADGPALWQLPGALLLVAFFGLIIAARQRAPVVSFGLAWTGLALLPVSNFLIPTGILIAERTLFLPSVGAMIAVGGAMPLVAARLPTAAVRRAAFATVGILIVAATARSIERTTVWRDNETLFTRAVEDAPLSYRSHYMLAGWRFNEKRIPEGEQELLIALRLFPREPYMIYNMAEEYRKAGLHEQAVAMYKRSLAILPIYKDALSRMAMSLANLGRFEEAEQTAMLAVRHGTKEIRPMREIILAAGRHRRGDTVAYRVVPDSAQSARSSLPSGR
jgi:hypothetical protein